jgi:hypothetical protein
MGVFLRRHGWIGLVVLTMLLAACGGKRVTRTDVSETIDLSGKWNDTDSRQVAQTMISDSLEGFWLRDFQQSHNRKPIVIAYGVKNRTAEHISTRTFMNDLERAFVNSGRVSVVARRDQRDEVEGERTAQQSGAVANPAAVGRELGADFVLTGELLDIRDRLEGQEVIFYQANLELISVETTEKVWIGDHKIKKLIDRSSTKF